MNINILSKENASEIISRSTYWDEVVKREQDVDMILRMELREVIQSLGIKILWVLKEYAKECKKEE